MTLDFSFPATGALSQLARAHGYRTFAEVAEAVRALPFGRVSDPEDIGAVLKERKGTCSSKHRFLAALAHECGRTDVQLMVGLYEMSEANTPGVAAALGDLPSIPEAHCYLMVEGKRLDFTGLAAGAASPLDALIEERPVSYTDLPSAKNAWHRRAIEAWARARGMDPEAAWQVRERCIQSLAAAGPIEIAIKQFCEAAIEKGDFAQGARDRKLHDAMAKAVAALRSSGEAGIAAFRSLMSHESPHVRAWVCADLLANGDESARPVLEALAALPGVTGHGAVIVLREHEAGRLRSPFADA